MRTARYINSISGIALAAVAVVFLAAFDTAYAQPAQKPDKKSMKQSMDIKQYCKVRWAGNKDRVAACIAGEEAAVQRLDKRSIDPKVKTFCRGVVRAGQYSMVEKCVSSLEKPKPRPKSTKKGRVAPFPEKKAPKAVVEAERPRWPVRVGGPADDGQNPVR